MTTRSTRKPKAKADNSSASATVEVVAPHAVYLDGEQRTGTLTDVPAATAKHWQRHGWVTVADDQPAKAKAQPKPEPTE